MTARLTFATLAAVLTASSTVAPVSAESPTHLSITNEYLVFQDTSTQKLDLSPSSDVYAYAITNASGKSVKTGSIPAGAKSLDLTLPTGWYELKLIDVNDGSMITTSLMVAPQGKQNPKLGVQVHLTNPPGYYSGWSPRVLPLAKMLGAGAVRDDLYFENFTKDPGKFTTPWAVANTILLSKSLGMSILPNANFSGTYSPNGYGFPQTPSQWDEYGEQISKFLSQNPDVKKVEIWNEFDDGMGMPKGQSRAADFYVKALSHVYGIIKAAHPDVTVVAGATTGYNATWWKDFFAAGGVQYSDAYSYHPYGASETELTQFSADIKSMSVKNGGHAKPIFVSENGWNDLALNRDTLVGPRGAADRLAISLAQAAGDPLVKEVFIYDLVNDGPDSAPRDATKVEANYGLFRPPNSSVKGYAPKRTAFSFWTFNKQSQSAPGSTKKVEYSDSGRVVSYGLNDNVKMLMQAQLKATPATPISKVVKVDSSKYTTVTDSMGAVVVPRGKRGSVQVTLADSPLYVESSSS